jgi:GH24 family phage-related lysozyme (muramidase)
MYKPTDRQKKYAAVSALAVAIAIPAEGLRQWAYEDIANPKLLTVCYGSTTNVQKGVKYSLDECKARLDDDMRAAIAQVDACAPGLPVPVLAAFGDAVYNLGPKIACDTTHSTAARLLKAGDLAGACQQLPRWNRATVAGRSVELPGLTKRRAKEMNLCLEGVA